jgi:Rieske Fe-S protein
MKARPSARALGVLRLLEGRRRFIAAGLALLGFGRRASAQPVDPSAPVHYAALTRPVRIPVEAVTTPWQAVPFVAEGAQGARRVLISGVLFRTHTQLSALCVTCPHEQCQVDLVTDHERLARIAGDKATHPLFECGCHFSVFDAAQQGVRLSGESPRGLYRFRIAGVRDGMVEISEVEEVALFEV